MAGVAIESSTFGTPEFCEMRARWALITSALIGGLAIAVVLAVYPEIALRLDLPIWLTEGAGLATIPAIAALLAAYLLNQKVKQQQAYVTALAAASEVEQARQYASELETLVVFGQALARCHDLEALMEASSSYLPQLASGEDAWVLVRQGSGWNALIGTADRTTEGLADRAFWDQMEGGSPRREYDNQSCFPLTVGDAIVGVLGVPHPQPLGERRLQVIAAAAALLAIAIKNIQLFEEIREHSVVDGLTGCFNRTYGLGVIDTELRRARRSHSPLCLIMLDIDHFKNINDRYGHLCGDSVLAAVGRRMRELLRNSDVKCRYGGEEFVVLLPDTPLTGALHVAESIRREIGAIQLQWRETTVAVTASIGLTAAGPAELEVSTLVGRADAALYRAKREGRNCVRVELAALAPSPTATTPVGVAAPPPSTKIGGAASESVGAVREPPYGQTTGRPLTSRTRNNTMATTSST
jgi:diguanylate cyclase (GGDEF)-like protein